jgi:hypothetical protein
MGTLGASDSIKKITSNNPYCINGPPLLLEILVADIVGYFHWIFLCITGKKTDLVIRWMIIWGTANVNHQCVLSSPCDFHDFCMEMQAVNVLVFSIILATK